MRFFVFFITVFFSISLSCQELKYGYVNRDSLYMLMPGYKSASDSVQAVRAKWMSTTDAMDKEYDQKKRERDSLEAHQSPLLYQLRTKQLEEMKANRNAYAKQGDDSIADAENKYLGIYYSQLKAAEDSVMKRNGFSTIIDAKNIPTSTERMDISFFDANAEVAKQLGLKP